ncbi:MAG: hypothetical protein M0031_15975 [Thermaerobacter sp.]|nr:hypothetical protein [Thermaerobacter sp.]
MAIKRCHVDVAATPDQIFPVILETIQQLPPYRLRVTDPTTGVVKATKPAGLLGLLENSHGEVVEIQILLLQPGRCRVGFTSAQKSCFSLRPQRLQVDYAGRNGRILQELTQSFLAAARWTLPNRVGDVVGPY